MADPQAAVAASADAAAARSLLENAKMHLDGLLGAACELRDGHFALSYPELLQRLQVISARVGALAMDLPAARLRDYIVLPFAVGPGPTGDPGAGAHAPEWLRTRPDPPIAARDNGLIAAVRDELAAAPTASATGDLDGAGIPGARKRRRLGLGALPFAAAGGAAPEPGTAQAGAGAGATDAWASGEDKLMVRLQAQIGMHDNLVNESVDFFRARRAELEPNLFRAYVPEEESDDEDADGAAARTTPGEDASGGADETYSGGPGKTAKGVAKSAKGVAGSKKKHASKKHKSRATKGGKGIPREAAAARPAPARPLDAHELRTRLADLVLFMHGGALAPAPTRVAANLARQAAAVGGPTAGPAGHPTQSR